MIQLSRAGLSSAFNAKGELPEVIALLTDRRRPLDPAPAFLGRNYGLTRAKTRWQRTNLQF